MSIHIGAEQGQIANTVLLSGDPLRSKFIAENILEDAVCYTDVRNMLGFTGYYKGEKVSVQGTGMGQPSLAIYLHELIHSYGVKQAIRVGTCGALNTGLKLGDLVLAQGACSDSTVNKKTFDGDDYAAIADFELLLAAVNVAQSLGAKFSVGNIFSTDLFYAENDPERWEVWRNHNVLCTEMETSLLYTMAARYDIKALSILTVSDNIITGESSKAKERERSFMEMVEIALGCIK